MTRKIFIALGLILMLATLAPGAAQATKPCMTPDEATFAAIVEAAPLVLRGRVAESYAGGKDGGTSWTDVDVIEIFRGGLPGRGVRIAGWAAQDMPLFNYAPGAELIFLLKPAKTGNDMVLADDDWMRCVPALMPRLDDGSYGVNAQKMRLETFLREYIRKTPGMSELSTSTVAVRAGKLYILAMMGPTRPVIHVGDPVPPDVPAPDVTVEIHDETGKTIALAMTGKDGKVDFTLPPGSYTIEAHPRPIARSKNTPMNIKIAPGAEERVKLDIDTGIR